MSRVIYLGDLGDNVPKVFHAGRLRRGAEKIYVEVGDKWECSMLSNNEEEGLHFND